MNASVTKTNARFTLRALLGVIVIIAIAVTNFSSALGDDKTVSVVTTKDEVVQMPQYLGGEKAMTDFILSNVKYPSVSREKNIQGIVLVRMEIGKDGKVHDTNIKKSVYPDIDQEAISVVSKMPNWTPGTINGEPVEMSVTIPINFKLK
jgi:TonB family protein